MIFRQFLDTVSSTYTYLIASSKGRECLIIDPVKEHVELYLMIINQLDLRLVTSIDTHTHADHITGSGTLQQLKGCMTLMGEHTQAECVSIKVKEGEKIKVDGITFEALYTPGHTNDSYCYVMVDRIFTGDTLLIRGTGRTDFQNGDPYAEYDSLFNKILKLPDDTLVYPAHDYKGMTVSSIEEEKKYNPRLQVKSAEEFAAIMNALNLPKPKLMDIAIPANLKCGLSGSVASV